MKHILVTGGAGYIGSHVVVELVAAGYKPVIIDNFSTSDKTALTHLEKLLGHPVPFYESDYRDTDRVRDILTRESIDGVIHIAAFKAVAESVEQPLKYYQNNVAGFVTLLETLLAMHVNHFVFSSSAAVYGTPPTEIVTEETPCAPESPYGQTKYMDEIILRDTCHANPNLKGIALRYFNVVGSHESAIIGESPKGKPQNLLPIIVKAVADNKPLTVYGTDYPTRDGTCLRDYIHVVDLARAHVAALASIEKANVNNYRTYNISTGKATSVLELIHAFEQINKVAVPHQLGARRAGDPVAYYAIAQKGQEELGWKATLTTEDAVRSAWEWHKRKSNEKR
jgi:UDP-glucose 4-epimerase